MRGRKLESCVRKLATALDGCGPDGECSIYAEITIIAVYFHWSVDHVWFFLENATILDDEDISHSAKKKTFIWSIVNFIWIGLYAIFHVSKTYITHIF